MTKTISLSDEAYERLAALKGPEDSFSDVALRLARAVDQERVTDLAGAWDLDEDQKDAMKERIREARDRSDDPPVDVP